MQCHQVAAKKQFAVHEKHLNSEEKFALHGLQLPAYNTLERALSHTE